MSTSAPESIGVLRLTVRIHADEFPLLTQALLRCGKGRRRAARLANLAAIGLLSERHAMRDSFDAGASMRINHSSAQTNSQPETPDIEDSALSPQQLVDLLGLESGHDQDA